MSSRRTVLISILTVTLTACGFRLAGTSDLPPQLASLYLKTNNFSGRQSKALRRTLEAAGAQLVGADDGQAARLSVNLKTPPDQQLATGAGSGEIVKRISRSLDFDVKGADGNLIQPARSLKQQKDIVLDDDNLLASNRERDAVATELEQALFDQLVRQLARR